MGKILLTGCAEHKQNQRGIASTFFDCHPHGVEHGLWYKWSNISSLGASARGEASSGIAVAESSGEEVQALDPHD